MPLNLKMIPNFELDPLGELGELLKKKQIETFHAAIRFAYDLPYQRISNLEDLRLAATECRGTCSSKHGFLAKLAQENNEHSFQVELIVFPFYSSFAPSLKDRFEKFSIDYILEAHCYLKYKDQIIDITSSRFDCTRYYSENKAFSTQKLAFSQVGSYKQKLHEDLFRKWCKTLNKPFDGLWKLRCDLIQHLADLDKNNL
ncbi:MAG: hypothetical protein S4CHLAM7_13130 [Chlamydiae bacterium]|nr:hypothetical protein [Chlamydiota bacterium]